MGFIHAFDCEKYCYNCECELKMTIEVNENVCNINVSVCNSLFYSLLLKKKLKNFLVNVSFVVDYKKCQYYILMDIPPSAADGLKQDYNLSECLMLIKFHWSALINFTCNWLTM